MSAISVSKSDVPIGGNHPASTPSSSHDVVFSPAWQIADETIRNVARQYWYQHGLVGTSNIEARANELAALASCANELVAVSTAQIMEWANLRVLHYRCSVAPQYRRKEVTWRLTRFTFNLLEKWSSEHPVEACAGLLVTLEASQFVGHLGLPIITKHGMDLVFVGRNAESYQRRVIWFKHANVETAL